MESKETVSTVSNSKQESLLLALKNLEAEMAEEKSKVVRPAINLPKILIKKLLRLISLAAVVVIFIFLNDYIGSVLNWVLFSLTELLILLLFFKPGLIEWVLIYQRYAPERLRGSCRFEPSCSEYMLLAVEKYGVFKGFTKGVKRVFKCRYPNGGIDYP